MEREFCHGCHKWFARLEQHLAFNLICKSITTEHDRRLNLSRQRTATNNANNITSNDGPDPILGMEVDAFRPQLEDDDNMSTGRSTRRAKKQRRAELDDDHSEITYGDSRAAGAAGSNEVEVDDHFSMGTFGAVHEEAQPDAIADANEGTLPPSSAANDPSSTLYDPPLGKSFIVPVKEVLARIEPNTDEEDALLDLHFILSKAGAQLYLFDDLVAFIERHAGTTFKKGSTLPRRETLLKRMSEKHPVPPPDSVPVALEIDPGGDDGNLRRRTDVVKVQTWSFEKLIQDYLLDPILFGNKDNLVNADNPWGKYVPSGPNDKEVLASYWYSKTYDENITDPATQFLLAMEGYQDKTGKNAGITSFCGEPMLISALHLKKSVREQSSSWLVQAYLPDLEVGSSAKKKKYSHSNATRGRTNRNYHKVMKVVMDGILKVQQKGGFPAYVRMGDEVRRVWVKVVFAFMKGDAKSGDALVSRFGGKNCIARVPRACLSGLRFLDDPMRRCPWVRMADQKALNDKVAELSIEPPNESNKDRAARLRKRKEYTKALDDMSAHLCDNALFDINFGHNPFGAMLGTPSDMMHLYESGVLKRVLQTFTDSMSTNVQVGVDDLMEDLFCSQRTTLSSSTNFLRTNFRGGATQLTMLSSHHWPGMAFAFLLMLLTPKGKELCSSCFQENDAAEPDYDWDEAPGLDLEYVYQPPILAPEESKENDDSSDESEEEEDSSEKEEDDSSSDEEASELPQRKGGPIQMKCSLKQFVHLLENLLVFHAMYKYGPPLYGPDSSPSDADDLLLSVRKLVAEIITFCPRQDGNQWKLQKLHEMLHFPLMIFFFRHAENIDAGTGERHLKDVFKDVARNSQQRGQDIFLGQCAKRMQEKLIMLKAKQYSEAIDKLCAVDDPPAPDPNSVTTISNNPTALVRTLPHGPMYVINYHDISNDNGTSVGGCTAKLLGMNESTQIHPVLLSWLATNWDIEIGRNETSLHCYTEMHVKDGPRYRAHPNYQNEGPWQDWAMVSFGRNDEDGSLNKVPSRILLFYVHQSVDANGNTSRDIHAIVQTCEYQVGNVRRRRRNMEETNLCSRWQLSMKSSTRLRERVNVPELYSVKAEDIHESVLVFEEHPGLCESWSGRRYVWLVKDQRKEWSNMFPLPEH